MGGLEPDEATRLFGQSELAEQLFKLPVEQWSGPLRSGYGWHLVYITAKLPAESPALDTVREQVLADYTDEQRRLLNSQAYEKIRAKYRIRFDESDR